MSSEQPPLDPHLIEQTKQQIRMLVNQIAQLAKSGIGPEEFYAEFLPRVVSALAAVGGAIWVVEDQGHLSLGYQINLQETNLRNNEEGQIRHGRLLHKVLTTGEPALVPPQSGSGDDQQAANPTDFLLVLAPLKTDLEVVGVVEVFQRSGTGPASQTGYLRFLMEMCDRGSEFFKSHQLKHFSDRQLLWTQLEDFTRCVHASLDPREAAYTIANEGRRLIECDRVSVAISKGKKCHIEAVSGQDLFDKRSNVVRLLGKLATAAVNARENVWYTGDTSDMAPQVEDAVQEYVDESHSKTVAVLPLTRPLPEPDDEKEEIERREYPQQPIGALIVEQIEDSRIPEKMLHRVDVVGQHSATALANALEHDNLFLMPLWRTLGKVRWVLRARTLPKTGLIALAVVSALCCLFIPYPFKMQAKGTLQPVDRQQVFAGIDGVVEEVLVDDAEGPKTVQQGELLVRLRNPDLKVAIEDVEGQLGTTRKHVASIQRTLFEAANRMSPDELSTLYGELAENQQREASLEAQWLLYKEKEKDLEVRSPRKGQVTTFQVKKLLMTRPVQRGQSLMEVGDLEGDWQLEILMPDTLIGHVANWQAEEEKEDLEVQFILYGSTGTTHKGKIKRTDLSAEVRGEEGNTILIVVEIDDEVKKKLPHPLRPNSTVTAKVYCGKKAVGYVMFHRLFAFIESKILFRFF